MTVPPAPSRGIARQDGTGVIAEGARVVKVRSVASSRDLRRFIRLPWRIYAGDPAWVPPLIRDVRRVLDRDRHPFHEHAEVECFLATRDGETVGRVAGILNRAHIDFHEEPVAYFGLFESVDDDAVARTLLATVETWAAQRGMRALRGPFNLSTNDELYSGGVLVDGFDAPPLILMAHTPRYYAELIERAGYRKAKDLLSYWLEGREPPARISAAMERIRTRTGVHIRSLDLSRFDAEVERVQEVYNSAWERNWGFVPMSAAEIRYLARELRPVVRPELCAIAEIDGAPVGFALALPDYNQAMRHMNGRLLPFGLLEFAWYRRRIDAARVLTLGLKPGYRHQGLDALLILHIWRAAVKAGYPRGECSWILEDNWDMRRGLERLGARVYKTYRVFEKDIGG